MRLHPSPSTTTSHTQELGLGVNAAKHALDALKVQADALKAARLAKGGDGAQVGTADAFGAAAGALRAGAALQCTAWRAVVVALSRAMLHATLQAVAACHNHPHRSLTMPIQQTLPHLK